MLWTPELERPRVRPLEPIQVKAEGQPLFLLRDPLGLAREGVAVPLPVFLLLSQMTGLNTLEQIGVWFEKNFGQPLPAEVVRKVVRDLDEALCLESARFEKHRRERTEVYRQAPCREMTHAGGGYPITPEKFRRMFDAHFTMEGGPGRAPRAGTGPEIKAVVAPHIDFDRGGANYGWAYQALGDGPPPETVVILGTAHAPCDVPLTATRQSFATPLGPLGAETEFIDALGDRLGDSLFRNELIHVTEHSVEFQAVALRHVFPEADGVRIVPIICGSLHDVIEDGDTIESHPLDEAIEALRETVTQWPRRVTVIAGADLAHVGPQFGDEGPVTEELLAGVRRQDEEALALAAAGDAEGFVRSLRSTRNARRVCSVACIYTTLRLLPALGAGEGRVLHYMQSAHPSGQLAVTHASLVFH